MDFLDDEAGVSSNDEDNEVLVPSSQGKESRRPSKRRRLNHSQENSSDSGSDDYDLPSNHYIHVDDPDEGEAAKYKSKYDAVTHVPQFAHTQEETFVTQLTQPPSSPTVIRGPRWRKQATPPTPISRRNAHADQARSYSAMQQSKVPTPTCPLRPTDLSDEFDDDDPDLLEAFMSTPAELLQAQISHACESQNNSNSRISRSVQKSNSFRQTTLFGINTIQQDVHQTQVARIHNWPLANKNEPTTHHTIDRNAMKTWVYPTNLGKVRDYQFNIVHKGLYHNLLVALPTGLGKTFIAATVMLNWFRWTKNTQIVFVAPTKPLVAQQIDACFHIVGIPRSQTTMLTGEVAPAVRAEEWQEKRVFFMTPQTLVNDLKIGICDPKKIVLLVVDEAHKATGNYAYVEVVRFIRRFSSSFRVLALTATPGSTVEAVQKVIDGLDISRVEIRTEESLDIRSFVHSRDTELEVFDNSDEQVMSLELFSDAVRPVMNKLNSLNAYWGKDPTMITLFGLKTACDSWAKSEAGKAAGWGLKGMIHRTFGTLMSLAHNLELLKYHGIGPFFRKMKEFEASATGKEAKQILDHESFKKLMNRVSTWVNDSDFVGHPKLSYLKTVVLNHFMDAGDGRGTAGGRGPSETRIMIFAHYRDSAEEICRVMNRHGPMIRAHVFVGQSGTKGSDGMDQKTQLDVIKKFKSGIYNTLVATSIGEEGLDIGEVDLIVCYDCSKSPIRMLQRMGRTGRKRAGKIVLLLMRGKEESDYYKAKDNYQKMQEIIENGKEFIFHEDRSPRIVPKDITPVVDKRTVEIPIENTQAESLDPRNRKAKNPKRLSKKFHMPDGVETGFTFLSKGKKGQHKLLPSQPLIDAEIAGVQGLEQVLLTLEEEVQLEQRYAQVAGSEPQFVQQVRLESFPGSLHKLGKTSMVGHSNNTKSLVRGFKNAHKVGRDWSRPTEGDILGEIDVGESVIRSQGSPNPKRLARTTSRTSETLQSSGTVMPADEYDTDDSFIDDQPVIQGAASSHQQAVNQQSLEDQPFWISQNIPQGDHRTEDELPELGDLMATGKMSRSSRKHKTAPAGIVGNRRKAKRIMDSDDDDDDE